MSDKQCDVCEGHGVYPILDKHGTERMVITCPICFGDGTAIDEDDDDDDDSVGVDDLPPRSTAADIESLEQLREYVNRNNEK